jgi:opacity protein-like surface antigen
METESDVFLTFGFLLMIRVPPEFVNAHMLGFLQPYGGIGGGITHISFQDLRVYDNAGNLVSSNHLDLDEVTLGFLGLAGMNFIITKHVKLFTEIKYHPLDVSNKNSFFFGVDEVNGDLSDTTLMAGLTYNF